MKQLFILFAILSCATLVMAFDRVVVCEDAYAEY
jgi:hypothetical protein